MPSRQKFLSISTVNRWIRPIRGLAWKS